MIHHPNKSGFVSLRIRSKGWVRQPYNYQSLTPPFRVSKKPVLIKAEESTAWITQMRNWCEEHLETLEVYELELPRFII